MDYRTCSICAKSQPVSSFHKAKDRTDGLKTYCSDCNTAKFIKIRRTKKGLIGRIYCEQKSSSRHRNHPMPEYSVNELREWVFNKPIFHVLFDAWERSGYEKYLTPSIDRIDDYKHYTLDNIRIVTWRENNTRSHSDMRNGINNKQSKAVLQVGLNGSVIKEYYSLAQASRETGCNISHISSFCNNKYGFQSVGGYKWKFK